jgi:predicted amidohydrolase YtcJ
MDPLEGIQNAVTRRLNEASPSWLPEQRVTVEHAVICYTRDAAFVANRDNVGVLEEGKLADFIVLDQNIFDIDPMTIASTRVLYTYLSGSLVFDHTDEAILVPGG